MEPWFEKVLETHGRGKVHLAMDILYDIVDEMLLSAESGKVDEFLQGVDIPVTPTVLLVGILTITLRAWDSLPSRKLFFEAAKAELDKRGEPEATLKGLDKWRL